MRGKVETNAFAVYGACCLVILCLTLLWAGEVSSPTIQNFFMWFTGCMGFFYAVMLIALVVRDVE